MFAGHREVPTLALTKRPKEHLVPIGTIDVGIREVSFWDSRSAGICLSGSRLLHLNSEIGLKYID
jgi:hypothetical protein